MESDDGKASSRTREASQEAADAQTRQALLLERDVATRESKMHITRMGNETSHEALPHVSEQATELLTGDLFDVISPFLTLQCVLRMEQVSHALLTRVSLNSYACLKHLSHAYTVGHPHCNSFNHKQVLCKRIVCLPNASADQELSTTVYPYYVSENFVSRRGLEHFPSTLQFSAVLWFRTANHESPYAGLLCHAFQEQNHQHFAGFKICLKSSTEVQFYASQHSSYYTSSTVDVGRRNLWDNHWHFVACVCDGTHSRITCDAISEPRPGVATHDIRGVQTVNEYGRLQVPCSHHILGRE